MNRREGDHKAFKQLSLLKGQIESMVEKTTKKEEVNKKMIAKAHVKADNTKNYALNLIEKEDQVRLMALRRSMPKIVPGGDGGSDHEPTPKVKAVEKAKKLWTEGNEKTMRESHEYSNRIKAYRDGLMNHGSFDEKAVNSSARPNLAMDHLLLKRPGISHKDKFVHESPLKYRLPISEAKAKQDLSPRKISPTRKVNKPKPVKITSADESEAVESPNFSREDANKYPKTSRFKEEVQDKSNNKEKSSLVPTSLNKVKSQHCLTEVKPNTVSNMEAYIQQRCQEIQGDSQLKVDSLKFLEKHRLSTLYQQKTKIMKISKVASNLKEVKVEMDELNENEKCPKTLASLKAVFLNNSNEHNTSPRKNRDDLNESPKHATRDVEKLKASSAQATKGLMSNFSSSKNKVSSRSAAKIMDVNKMIQFLKDDKDLSSQKSSFRTSMQVLRDMTASDNETTDHENLKFYRFLKKLGDGASSSVSLVVDVRDGKKFAMKVFCKSKVNQEKAPQFAKEGVVLAKCDHANVVKLIDQFESTRKLYMVLEYVGPHTLAQYIENKNSEKNQIDEDEGAHIFYEVAQGLAYLHSKHIYHRDMKLHNIIIGIQGEVKIIDLGYAVEIDPGSTVDTFCGTPTYMPPEVVDRLPYQPALSDVWSFGVCLYRGLCGRFPFLGVSQTNLFYHIRKGQFTLPDYLSQNCKNLISSLLQVNPANRPSMAQVLQHAWFSGCNLESTADI